MFVENLSFHLDLLSLSLYFLCMNTCIYCSCLVSWVRGLIHLKYNLEVTSKQSLLRSRCCWKDVHKAVSSVAREQIGTTTFILHSYNYQVNLITLRDFNFWYSRTCLLIMFYSHSIFGNQSIQYFLSKTPAWSAWTFLKGNFHSCLTRRKTCQWQFRLLLEVFCCSMLLFLFSQLFACIFVKASWRTFSVSLCTLQSYWRQTCCK